MGKKGAGAGISTHAPLAGRDVYDADLQQVHFAFQPTRPLRGATVPIQAFEAGPDDFNPRAPCGARHRFCAYHHAPTYFNPRAPCGARQRYHVRQRQRRGISTHAPLAGRDQHHQLTSYTRLHFNPRAPCGARQQKCTNHYAHFCDNRQISDAFAQNAACQGILLLFDAGKPCGFWVRTAQVISAHLCFAL